VCQQNILHFFVTGKWLLDFGLNQIQVQALIVLLAAQPFVNYTTQPDSRFDR
jgi:hypothetical protein